MNTEAHPGLEVARFAEMAANRVRALPILPHGGPPRRWSLPILPLFRGALAGVADSAAILGADG